MALQCSPRIQALLPVACLAACAVAVLVGWRVWAPSSYLPEFMRHPYERLSREEVVAVARREWLLFGQPVHDEMQEDADNPDAADKPERDPGLWQRVGEYLWLGLDPASEQRAATGKHDEFGVYLPPEKDWMYAWSAAFISYVMRVSGAGDRFPYAENHSRYINAAREASLGKRHDIIVFAEDPALYAPQVGDLICYARGRTWMLRFEDLPSDQQFSSHCDVVVEGQPQLLSVIGGNVGDAVSMKHVPVAEDGRLVGADGNILDTRYRWMAVLRIQYDPEPQP